MWSSGLKLGFRPLPPRSCPASLPADLTGLIKFHPGIRLGPSDVDIHAFHSWSCLGVVRTVWQPPDCQQFDQELQNLIRSGFCFFQAVVSPTRVTPEREWDGDGGSQASGTFLQYFYTGNKHTKALRGVCIPQIRVFWWSGLRFS